MLWDGNAFCSFKDKLFVFVRAISQAAGKVIGPIGDENKPSQYVHIIYNWFYYSNFINYLTNLDPNPLRGNQNNKLTCYNVPWPLIAEY